MEQLAELAGILDRTGIDWWADCGTLLGIRREGRLLEWDTDIDLAGWAQPDGWSQLAGTLREAGYRVHRHQYRRMLYRLWVTRPSGGLAADIRVVRRTRDVAWYPVKSAGAVGRLSPMRAARGIWKRSSILDRATGLLRQVGLELNSMQIPAGLLDGTVRFAVGGADVAIPERADDLLELHYGDWRVPVSGWSPRDDGAYRMHPPPVDVPSPPFI